RALNPFEIDYLYHRPGQALPDHPDLNILSQSGLFTDSMSVAMQGSLPDGQIRFTLDQSAPTTNSPLYTGPITLTQSTIVQARLFRTDFPVSPIMTATYQRVDETGLIAWWPGNGNGDDVIGLNPAILNNPLFVPAVSDRGFSLQGTNRTLSVPGTRSFSPLRSISIELWVNPAQSQGYFALGSNPRLELTDLDFGVMRARWSLFLDNRDGPGPEKLESQPLPLNTFTHVVATWDGVTRRLYLNGYLQVPERLDGR